MNSARTKKPKGKAKSKRTVAERVGQTIRHAEDIQARMARQAAEVEARMSRVFYFPKNGTRDIRVLVPLKDAVPVVMHERYGGGDGDAARAKSMTLRPCARHFGEQCPYPHTTGWVKQGGVKTQEAYALPMWNPDADVQQVLVVKVSEWSCLRDLVRIAEKYRGRIDRHWLEARRDGKRQRLAPYPEETDFELPEGEKVWTAKQVLAVLREDATRRDEAAKKSGPRGHADRAFDRDAPPAGRSGRPEYGNAEGGSVDPEEWE